MVLLDERSLDVGAKLSRLLLELVNRDLSHHEGEVFGWSLHLATLWVQTHGDVGLVRQTELLVVIDVVNVLVFADCVLGTGAIFARL